MSRVTFCHFKGILGKSVEVPKFYAVPATKMQRFKENRKKKNS